MGILRNKLQEGLIQGMSKSTEILEKSYSEIKIELQEIKAMIIQLEENLQHEKTKDNKTETKTE